MLDVETIKKLTNNALTPAALRNAGVSKVPVLPSGEIAEDALEKYITAGQPDGRFFEGYLLRTPEEWAEKRHVPAGLVEYDPISREVLAGAVAGEWTALAPVQVMGGGSVPAVDLVAYAAARGLLPSEISSTLARLVLPRGTAPVSSPGALERAALEWPYDPEAEEIARRRRRSPGAAEQQPTFEPPSSELPLVPSRGTHRDRPDGPPPTPKPRDVRLTDLLLQAFSVNELRQFVKGLPYGNQLSRELPEGTVSPSTLASAVVDLLTRHGTLDAVFFDQFLLTRSNYAHEITILRRDFGA